MSGLKRLINENPILRVSNEWPADYYFRCKNGHQIPELAMINGRRFVFNSFVEFPAQLAELITALRNTTRIGSSFDPTQKYYRQSILSFGTECTSEYHSNFRLLWKRIQNCFLQEIMRRNCRI